MGPGPAEFLSSVDLILHTGDVTGPGVLDWLETLGPPLVCTGGNHDLFKDERLQDVAIIEHEGWRIGACHIALDARKDPDRIPEMKRRWYHDPSLDILIAGDTHYERIEYVDRTLLLNSGSLLLPRNQTVRLGSVALLDVTRDYVHAEIIPLGETEGLKNPSWPASIDFDHEKVLRSSFRDEVIEPEDGLVEWPWPAPRDQM
jgi:putative phosphoesterase